MLYNPNWTETKPDVFSLDALIAWLEKQPAEQTYCYLDHGACLLGQYLKGHGFNWVMIYSSGEFDFERDCKIVRGEYPIEFDDFAAPFPHTFGAALQRAKAYRDGVVQ